MKFYIADTFTSGSGQEFNTKEAFLHELSLMIDDCAANGGEYFDIEVHTDASCFCIPSDDDPDPVETTEELVNFAKDLNSKRDTCGQGYYGEAEGRIGTGYFCKKKNSFVTGCECSRCEEV